MKNRHQGERRKFPARGAALVSGAAVLQGARADNLAGEAWERVYGAGFTRYGQPSRFEQGVGRHIAQPYGEMAPGSGAALSPIEALDGIITPTSVHFIRSHSGSPDIDPQLHRLYIHGLGERPLRFPLEALSRYPMVTRTSFIECSGNHPRALSPQPAQAP